MKNEKTSLGETIQTIQDKIDKIRKSYDRLWLAQKELKELGIEVIITKG